MWLPLDRLSSRSTPTQQPGLLRSLKKLLKATSLALMKATVVLLLILWVGSCHSKMALKLSSWSWTISGSYGNFIQRCLSRWLSSRIWTQTKVSDCWTRQLSICWYSSTWNKNFTSQASSSCLSLREAQCARVITSSIRIAKASFNFFWRRKNKRLRNVQRSLSCWMI